MKPRRLDIVALAAFVGIAIGGMWLWSGTGPLIWLSNFALMCGFG